MVLKFWLAALGLALNFQVLAAPLDVSDAWVQLAPPGAQAYAAYMTLKNSSDQTLKIKSVSADCCAMAMFHHTRVDHDSATMEAVYEPKIAAEQSWLLVPGGAHLMLMHPRRQLLIGDSVEITLEFSSGETQQLTLHVQADKTH